MLSFERLDVYQLAMEFYVLSIQVAAEIPKGYGDLADQLRRSSLSVINNIAESSGRLTKTDKKKFLGIARGSAMESAASLHAVYTLELCDQDTFDSGREKVVRIVSVLTKMCF